MSTSQIGFLLYPGLTQLDLSGPFEILSRLPDTETHLVWKDLNLVKSDTSLQLQPTVTIQDCPALDVIFVPGGPGQIELMQDEVVLDFLKQQGTNARYVTSVCTGALLLGAAGLLKGYQATTHWLFHDQLAQFGATATKGRVVADRNRITGGGVTAGIDFALTLAAELRSADIAKSIQLELEYNPAPPFNSGCPETADPELVQMFRTIGVRQFLQS